MCSHTCGEGVRSRSRHCSNPKPLHGGANCDRLGYSAQKERCTIVGCPGTHNFRGGGQNVFFSFRSDMLICSILSVILLS